MTDTTRIEVREDTTAVLPQTLSARPDSELAEVDLAEVIGGARKADAASQKNTRLTYVSPRLTSRVAGINPDG
jgi:hypothetical protein